MENNEFMSMKEISECLHVTKQRVYRCIRQNHIKEARIDIVKGNSVLIYDNHAIEQIKNSLSSSSSCNSTSSDVHQETVKKTVDEVLLIQLETKDNQIKELLKTIDDMREMHHTEILNLQQSLDQAQKLHYLDKQKILELESKDEQQLTQETVDHQENKKHWWKFGK